MSYAAGQTIRDDEYNDFAVGATSGTPNHTTRNLDSIFGTGSGNKGMGRTPTIGSVSAGSTITATQWENLVARIELLGSHQSTTVTNYSTITAGSTISALGSINTDITNLYAKRGNAATAGTTATTSSNHTGSWNGCLTFTATHDFTSDATARYFFNSGGRIAIDFTNQGGGSGNKDTAWANLIAAAGPVYLTAAGPSGPATTVVIAGTTYQGTDHKGTGSPTTETNKGFFDLTSSYQELFKQLDTTYDYTTNYISINIKYVSSTGTITFLVRLQDTQYGSEHNPTLANPTNRDELVNLNIQCDLKSHPSNSTVTWGTISRSVSSSATTGTGYTC
jgi:hypothetical protein